MDQTLVGFLDFQEKVEVQNFLVLRKKQGCSSYPFPCNLVGCFQILVVVPVLFLNSLCTFCDSEVIQAKVLGRMRIKGIENWDLSHDILRWLNWSRGAEVRHQSAFETWKGFGQRLYKIRRKLGMRVKCPSCGWLKWEVFGSSDLQPEG